MARPLKAQTTWRDGAAWATLGAYALVLVFLALKPPSGNAGFEGQDKILHAGAFAVLFVLAWLAMRGRYPVRGVAGCMAFGAAIELAQGAMPFGREPSIADMLANSLGIGLGAGAIIVLKRVTARR
ncbi:MAG: VanZ family protein [Pseudomonadota bacterium]